MYLNFKEILMYQVFKRDTPVSDFQKEDTSASKRGQCPISTEEFNTIMSHQKGNQSAIKNRTKSN